MDPLGPRTVPDSVPDTPDAVVAQMLPDLAIDIILLTRRIVENYFRLILIDGNKKSGNTFLPGWQCYFSFHSNGGFCFSLALLSSLFSTLS